jgi:signal transduction histidine kinase
MNPESALFLPLVAREQLIGALTLFRTKKAFDRDDIDFAEDLARLAALALDNARLHDTVRASLRARDELVGVVSHDLRNPVAAVKMLSRMMLRGPNNGGPESREHLELIAQAAEQMTRSSNQSRMAATGDLAVPVIRRCCSRFAYFGRSSRRTIASTFRSNPLPQVMADRERISKRSRISWETRSSSPPQGRRTWLARGESRTM